MGKAPFKVGLLISTYNWPAALDLIFKSIRMQSYLPDEILIADDGSGVETQQLIRLHQQTSRIPIKHAWHEDEGFRKSLILNKAIKQAEADYIIEIDGDILLHRHFIADHIRHAQRGIFIQGARAMVNEARTKALLHGASKQPSFYSNGISNRFNAFRLPIFSSIFPSNPGSSNNIKGCNIAFWREDFIAINGYNNTFFGWGSEDNEFAARLINAGIAKKRLKFAAICFHLHHPLNAQDQSAVNRSRYQYTMINKVVSCENGYAEV
ncbi:hypothetical protein LX64_01687 [Chitinophaga skermanii]|uniref:Glycosyltransferase involved in cell wall biosynthesis n=1 Tax=Chitinophaga skermanii TaxID=331697 RepID=A0A327QQD8_9BACT|nr:glycosyltransferase family 2 protein [Chitinophaga skermanii]RAJ06560.1 hypothetical protein LX64_01687 [Chitinophaga skermanii]